MQLATGGPIYLARTRSRGPMQLAGDTVDSEDSAGAGKSPTPVIHRLAPKGAAKSSRPAVDADESTRPAAMSHPGIRINLIDLGDVR